MTSPDRIFIQELELPYPIDYVFDFFSNAANLEAITPPSLQFHVLTPPPIVMQTGTVIDYRLKLMGIPFHWQSLIEDWQPGKRFVDIQLKGPYLKWVHTHTFTEENGKVLMKDHVAYRVPGWILEPLIHKLFVGPQVRAIFMHRSKIITQLLEAGH